jgi:hypothetical protein
MGNLALMNPAIESLHVTGLLPKLQAERDEAHLALVPTFGSNRSFGSDIQGEVRFYAGSNRSEFQPFSASCNLSEKSRRRCLGKLHHKRPWLLCFRRPRGQIRG